MSWAIRGKSFQRDSVTEVLLRRWMPLEGDARAEHMAARYVRVSIQDAPTEGVTLLDVSLSLSLVLSFGRRCHLCLC